MSKLTSERVIMITGSLVNFITTYHDNKKYNYKPIVLTATVQFGTAWGELQSIRPIAQ
jgi:hypothetical protein